MPKLMSEKRAANLAKSLESDLRRLKKVNPDEIIADKWKLWDRNIALFSSEALGINLSGQQERVLKEFADICHAKIKLFQSKQPAYSGEKMTEQELVYSRKVGVSVMSGKGCGKDTLAVVAMMWFMTMFPFPKVLASGPSADQLQSVLWSEIAKWLYARDNFGKQRCVFADLFEMQSKKLFYKGPDIDPKQIGKRWFAEARTCSANMSAEQQALTLSGRHEDYTLLVLDEAAGIPDAVFGVLESSMTGICNVALLIWNPTRRDGFAYRTHYGIESEQQSWVQVHLDSRNSPFVTKESIEKIAAIHGVNSNYFRVYVAGLPPFVDHETLIPSEWVEAAIDRNEKIIADSEPVVVGVDPALGGGAEAAIYVRQGAKGLNIQAFPLIKDPDELGLKVLEIIREYDADFCCVDPIGIGIAVVAFLRRTWDKGRVTPVDVRHTARNQERFVRLRDELWWTMRERFREGMIGIPKDELLKSQLSTIKQLSPNSEGKLRIEDKFSLKHRNAGSLDRAEALMLTIKYDWMMDMKKKQGDAYEREADRQKWMSGKGALSWMSA